MNNLIITQKFNAFLQFTAVTLEGTVIHKSGLITGGRSTHNNQKKWEEKDVQGRLLDLYLFIFLIVVGLTRVRDKLLSDLRELNKSKPRSGTDENLLAELTRLDSAKQLAKDDLVLNFITSSISL